MVFDGKFCGDLMEMEWWYGAFRRVLGLLPLVFSHPAIRLGFEINHPASLGFPMTMEKPKWDVRTLGLPCSETIIRGREEESITKLEVAKQIPHSYKLHLDKLRRAESCFYEIVQQSIRRNHQVTRLFLHVWSINGFEKKDIPNSHILASFSWFKLPILGISFLGGIFPSSALAAKQLLLLRRALNTPGRAKSNWSLQRESHVEMMRMSSESTVRIKNHQWKRRDGEVTLNPQML